MAIPTSLKRGSLDCVRLQELIELGPIAPLTLEIVELDLPGAAIANHWVTPLHLLNDPAGLQPRKKLGFTVIRFRQLQSIAGGPN